MRVVALMQYVEYIYIAGEKSIQLRISIILTDNLGKVRVREDTFYIKLFTEHLE